MLPSDTSFNNECAVEILIPLKHLKLLPLSSNTFDADFLTEVALILYAGLLNVCQKLLKLCKICLQVTLLDEKSSHPLVVQPE